MANSGDTTNDHNFRYLLKPGNDFKLASQFKAWVIISTLLCFASIGLLFVNKAVRGDYLNWTIDFKGGTELVFSFSSKADPNGHVAVDLATVKKAIHDTGDADAEISESAWGDGNSIHGMIVSTKKFGALTPAQQQTASAAIMQRFVELTVNPQSGPDKGNVLPAIEKVSWSGDRVFIRTLMPLADDDIAQVLAGQKLEMKPVDPKQEAINNALNQDTKEYNETFAVYGLDRQYKQAIENAIPDTVVNIESSSGISAKAGDKLRNDGIKALFYAMGLIMLYLAIRFDIRYAPGAVVAMIHDALMVIGAFALTWTDVSLTSVAALLTVIGFSVNDTVIIFDRMRENMAKLKDKKIERVVEISLNEVLVRSILTSFTLFCTTLMMNVFGTGLVKNFAFAMNVGIIVGSYSSIFLAPPLFLWIHRHWYAGPPPARARRAAQVAAET